MNEPNALPPLVPAAPKQRNWFARHKIATGALALVAVAALGSAMGGGASDTTTAASKSTPITDAPAVVPAVEAEPAAEPAVEQPAAPVVEAAPVAEPVAEPVAVEPEFTAGQRNAISKAQNYLEFSAFSKSGLISQLAFEGFAAKDAAFAVENIEVDWMEQAAKKAASYLESSSFSQSALVEQLEFEGFTSAQARHGAAVAYK